MLVAMTTAVQATLQTLGVSNTPNLDPTKLKAFWFTAGIGSVAVILLTMVALAAYRWYELRKFPYLMPTSFERDDAIEVAKGRFIVATLFLSILPIFGCLIHLILFWDRYATAY